MLFKLFVIIATLLLPARAEAHGPGIHSHTYVQCEQGFIRVPGFYDQWGRRWVPGRTYYGTRCWDHMGNIVSQTPAPRAIVTRPAWGVRTTGFAVRPSRRIYTTPRAPSHRTYRPAHRRVPPARRDAGSRSHRTSPRRR